MTLVKEMNTLLKENVTIKTRKISHASHLKNSIRKTHEKYTDNISSITYNFYDREISLKLKLLTERMKRRAFKFRKCHITELIEKICSCVSDDIFIVSIANAFFLKKNDIIEKCFFDCNICTLVPLELTEKEKTLRDMFIKIDHISFYKFAHFEREIKYNFGENFAEIYQKQNLSIIEKNNRFEIKVRDYLIDKRTIEKNEERFELEKCELDYEKDILPNINNLVEIVEITSSCLYNKKKNILYIKGIKIRNPFLINFLFQETKNSTIFSVEKIILKNKIFYSIIENTQQKFYFLYDDESNTFKVIKDEYKIATNYSEFIFFLYFNKEIKLRYEINNEKELYSAGTPILEGLPHEGYDSLSHSFKKYFLEAFNIPEYMVKNAEILFQDEKQIFFIIKEKECTKQIFCFDVKMKETLLWNCEEENEVIDHYNLIQLQNIFKKHKEKTKNNMEDYEQYLLFKN